MKSSYEKNRYRLTVFIDKNIEKYAKMKATDKETSLSDVVNEFLKEWIKSK